MKPGRAGQVLNWPSLTPSGIKDYFFSGIEQSNNRGCTTTRLHGAQRMPYVKAHRSIVIHHLKVCTATLKSCIYPRKLSVTRDVLCWMDKVSPVGDVLGVCFCLKRPKIQTTSVSSTGGGDPWVPLAYALSQESPEAWKMTGFKAGGDWVSFLCYRGNCQPTSDPVGLAACIGHAFHPSIEGAGQELLPHGLLEPSTHAVLQAWTAVGSIFPYRFHRGHCRGQLV